MLKVLVFTSHERVLDLSYYWDWYEALTSHPLMRVDVVRTHPCERLAFDLWRRRHASFDLIFFPYGFYNRNSHPRNRALFAWFSNTKGKRVFFLENEYRLLNHKLAYALSLGADYITSQLPHDVAEQVYRPFFPIDRIVSLPHAMNPHVVARASGVQSGRSRKIDLDLTGDAFAGYLGHNDRERAAEFAKTCETRYGLKVNVAVGSGARLDRMRWIGHLLECKGVVHHESGSDFLETNDETRSKYNALWPTHAGATFEEMYERFFRGYQKPISGRAISSRHFDAIAARTCQIMFPGRYNDILEPGEHYIRLERDLSNSDEVVAMFRDERFRHDMVERTYQYSMESHTHKHRIDCLLRRIGAT